MQLKQRIRTLRKYLPKRVWFFGWAHYCPVCRSHLRRFFSHGVIARPAAQCPVCQSLERHRLLWLFFTRRTSLFEATPKRLLHVAPERAFARHFERLAYLDYVTTDLFAQNVTVQMDICKLGCLEESFDVILCNHVLEHIPDDRQAMRELYRVLKTGGWAVLLVPITVQKTFEDPSITDPAERERLFGQHDHVRRYGPDYVHRLEEAGFAVKRIPATDMVAAARFRYFGIRGSEEIFLCTKG
jgi:SAM-dependent methyltransferase